MHKEISCSECCIENCLENTNCVRYNKELLLGKEVKRYQILDSKSNNVIQEWTNI